MAPHISPPPAAREAPAVASDRSGRDHLIRYEQMMDEIMPVVGIRRVKLHVPIALRRLPVLIMDKVLPNPPVAVEQLKMLRLDNSAGDNATERLTGQPLRDFRD